ncbi:MULTISPECIES: hypothetical protein [unclassified Mesorhizobium]|nr:MULTISPECIES: hypothetical protein [unclassified Mesorhizobium]
MRHAATVTKMPLAKKQICGKALPCSMAGSAAETRDKATAAELRPVAK